VSPEHVVHRFADIVKPGVTFVQAEVTGIDPVTRQVTTSAGELACDVLVVALGADLHPELPPGLVEGGHEFYPVAGAFAVADALRAFEGGRVVVGVTSTPFKCPPAPSETTLMVHDLLEERGLIGVSSVELVLPLPVPIPPSPQASATILETFADRGIAFRGGTLVTALDPDRKVALLSDGTELPYDLFLGIPVHRVPAVVAESGLAEGGWIPVEKGSAATRFPGVFAVGDVTSVGTPRAGVFAEGAARAMAEQIAARIRGDAEPAGYDGTGACYVELGEGEVGAIRVDFFSEPGRPLGWFTEPTAETGLAKADFGASRRARWFGPKR
jgi:sulfide:quinone oxidoreductase